MPHDLIHHNLEHNRIPHNLREYIKELYRKTTSKVTTKYFHSDHSSFKKIVIQGDPLSQIILVFKCQLMIDFLIQNLNSVVEINGKKS